MVRKTQRKIHRKLAKLETKKAKHIEFIASTNKKHKRLAEYSTVSKQIKNVDSIIGTESSKLERNKLQVIKHNLLTNKKRMKHELSNIGITKKRKATFAKLDANHKTHTAKLMKLDKEANTYKSKVESGQLAEIQRANWLTGKKRYTGKFIANMELMKTPSYFIGTKFNVNGKPKTINELKARDFYKPGVADTYLGKMDYMRTKMVKINPALDWTAFHPEVKAQFASRIKQIVDDNTIEPHNKLREFNKELTNATYNDIRYRQIPPELHKNASAVIERIKAGYGYAGNGKITKKRAKTYSQTAGPRYLSSFPLEPVPDNQENTERERRRKIANPVLKIPLNPGKPFGWGEPSNLGSTEVIGAVHDNPGFEPKDYVNIPVAQLQRPTEYMKIGEAEPPIYEEIGNPSTGEYLEIGPTNESTA